MICAAMRLPLTVLPIVLLLNMATTVWAAPYHGRTFETEQKALWGCLGAEVVWVDPRTGFWYRKGDGRYADSEDGAYACRGEVEITPRRPSKPAPPAPPPLLPAPDYEDE
jgi:hypothetical protein